MELGVCDRIPFGRTRQSRQGQQAVQRVNQESVEKDMWGLTYRIKELVEENKRLRTALDELMGALVQMDLPDARRREIVQRVKRDLKSY
jgi:regulator of replication initiation timing